MTRRATIILLVLSFSALAAAVALRRPEGLLASVQDGLLGLAGVDLPQGDPRTEVTETLNFLVKFVALAAVIAVVAAGMIFIVSFGSDTAVQRGRKIILYAIIGLLVIFFAAVIVGFFTREIPI